jgi:CheY-like chemotaxis protein
MKPSILIVDDEQSILTLLKKEFTDHAYTVYSAANGKEGLRMCKKHHPDIILADLLMPKMDGITMLREIRKLDEWGRTVPVVILTNLSTDNQTLEDITQTQPAFYLMKSNISMVEVLEKVDEALKSSNK